MIRRITATKLPTFCQLMRSGRILRGRRRKGRRGKAHNVRSLRSMGLGGVLTPAGREETFRPIDLPVTPLQPTA
jgi:hypothetical protein